MGILYLLSVVTLLTTFILVKKSEKEIDIISFICISIVTLFCYNTFVCYILTFFMIPNTLLTLSTINISVSLFFIFLIIRKKEIQRFSFKKIDIIYVSIIAICVLAVSYINFGFPFSVNYETGDPSVHYLTSMKFAKEETLMHNAEHDQVYGDLSVRKAASYVNSGILIKCFCEDYNFIECYYVFAGFGIFTLTLIGITMYSALKKYATKKEHTFFAFLVSLICILGYPLNSFLFGFEYLTMGVLVLCTIIDLVIYYYEKNILEFSYILIILGLLNFGLFCSYYMFIPFTYSALWIYFCIKNYTKTKKIVTKELVILLLVTLLIPFVLGYIYHLAPKIYGVIINQSADINTAMNYSAHLINTGLAVNGYIYINLYSNMILLLPLTIYFFVEKARNKKLKESILFFLVVFCIIFIEILLIGNCIGKVSIYYLSKNYFALWIMFAFTNYKALILIYDKNKNISRLFIYSYIFLMIFCTTISNVKVEYYITNAHENFLSVMDIFGANKTILLKKPKEYTQPEIEILDYVKNNLDLNSKIEFVTDENAYYWQYVLLDYIYKEGKFVGKSGGQGELTTKWAYLEKKVKNIDYMVYFKKTQRYKKMEDILFDDAEIIYENEAGGILKYKR